MVRVLLMLAVGSSMVVSVVWSRRSRRRRHLSGVEFGRSGRVET